MQNGNCVLGYGLLTYVDYSAVAGSFGHGGVLGHHLVNADGADGVFYLDAFVGEVALDFAF